MSSKRRPGSPFEGVINIFLIGALLLILLVVMAFATQGPSPEISTRAPLSAVEEPELATYLRDHPKVGRDDAITAIREAQYPNQFGPR